jgi:hypothetical protein
MAEQYPNKALGYQMKPYLMNLLRSNGFKGDASVAADGIIGNLVVESGWFDPAVISGERRGDGGKAVGLAQLHPDRWAVVEPNLRAKGLDPYTWQGQLVGIVDELLTTEQRAWRELERATTTQQAVEAFLFFERPGGFTRETRGTEVPSYDRRVMGANVFSQTSDQGMPTDMAQFNMDPDEMDGQMTPDQTIQGNTSANPLAMDMTDQERDFLSTYGILNKGQSSAPKLIEIKNLLLPNG